jgi:uncharacterized membrane protein YbhN (UPF0104 family)
VLAALGARIRFRLAADVILATFFVGHLTPFGSATGTLVNASALEADGIAAATTGEAIALTSLTSTSALIVLFGTGFVATAGRLASLARTALTRRAFAVSFGFAAGDLLLDLLSLDLVFLALGVIEVTLVAVTVGFGAPRATAVLAVLGYRIVNFWLPLVPGAIAYIRLRLRRAANGKTKPTTAQVVT